MNHEYYMGKALEQARTALAEGEFPVGCVYVVDGEIVAAGRRRNSSEDQRNEIDHAEIVTLRTLLAGPNGVDPAGIIAYTTMEPCLMCYATMLLSGIRTFVWAYEDVMGGGTSLSLTELPPLYARMQPTHFGGVLRTESLKLFQQFFSRFSYWQDSLLSQYTLEQSIEDTSS